MGPNTITSVYLTLYPKVIVINALSWNLYNMICLNMIPSHWQELNMKLQIWRPFILILIVHIKPNGIKETFYDMYWT